MILKHSGAMSWMLDQTSTPSELVEMAVDFRLLLEGVLPWILVLDCFIVKLDLILFWMIVNRLAILVPIHHT